MIPINMIVATLFLVLGVHFATSEECEYAKYDAEHTMCKYPEGVLGEACPAGTEKDQSLDDDQIRCVLDAHNNLRNKIAEGDISEQYPQLKAANMKELKWDSELASIAQRWANQCINGHDAGASARADGDFDQVGQNYVGAVSAGPISCEELKKSVDRWVYKEVGNMTDAYVENYPDDDTYKIVGHYSQVAWAETTNVGCGMVSYQNGDWIYTNLFCNYGPSGNFGNNPIYKVGEPATQCDNGVSPTYTGLCQ